MASISPTPKLQFFDNNGDPLVGGKLYSYAAGTTTPLATYTDYAGGTANSNPVILDSRGEASVWLSGAQYKLKLTTAADVDVWTVDNLNNADGATLAALAASGGSSLIGFLQSGTGAQARTVQSRLRDSVHAFDFMTSAQIADVQGNVGSVDVSAALQAAIDAAAGRPVYCPSGTYRLNSGLSYITAGGVFTKGLHIYGEGPDKTIFDFRGSTQAINVDTDTTVEFQMFVRIEGIKFVGSSATGTADAVRLRRAYMVTMDHVWITGFPGDGVAVIMNEGDADGSNMVHMRQCRIENCAGWGVNTDVTGPYNEFSFLLMEQVFIQSCGTSSASTPPPSGGIRWKGQVLHALDSAVVICENVGVYLQGGSGLANTATLTNFVLENNTKRGLYCTGIDGLSWNRGQLYNNNSYTATELVEFDGSSNTVRGVEINGLIVRATSGNSSCTAFKISGANVDFNTCRVRGTIWQNFDYAGQSRFSGWQFDQITQFCKLVALTTTSIILRPDQNYGGGATTPIRLRGANTGSSTGEWVPLTLANTGISATNSGLSANQRYYVYLYDNANSYELRFSGAAFVIDTATGYPVKSGDTSQLYVGSVETDGSGLFKLTAGGWLNPTPISGNQVGAPAYLWRDGSGQLRMKYAVLPTSDTDGTVIGP